MQVIFITCYSMALIFFVSVITCFPTRNPSPEASSRLPFSSTVLQLSKRGSLEDQETGLLNQKTLQAHLRYVLRKQVIGAMNYYKNTGNVLATFNMTPYELEDAYNSGSVHFLTPESDHEADGTDELTDEGTNSPPAIASMRKVDQTNSSMALSRFATRGATIVSMNNLGAKDLIWATTIQVGSPLKSFLISVDTGSSDFFVASDKCPNLQCAGKNIYIPQQSRTSQPQNYSYTISFGDGSSVQSDVMTDTVSLGGVTLRDIGIGAVTELSSQFQSSKGDTSDGLMGFGFPSLAQSKTVPFFTAMTQSNERQGVIGARFSRKSETGSELTIGGANPAAYRGALTPLNVLAMQGQPPGFWDVSLGGVIVNGKSMKISSKVATIDTGTSILGVPLKDARQIYASVAGAKSSGSGQYTFPCEALPMVSIVFGGREFEINPVDMSIGKDEYGNCVGGIIGLDRKDVWLVGQVFLKNVYTVFDQKNYSVSFANLA